MTYFTKDEALRVIENARISLVRYSPDNPNFGAMEALRQLAEEYRESPRWISIWAFSLGFAAGKRADRQRRKAAAT